MKYSSLGPTALNISRIGLGTMMIGWRADQKTTNLLIAAALDHGVNFFDSSISYSRGKCHQMIGESIRSLGCRSKIILATKIGGVANDEDPPSLKRYSFSNLISQCEKSLQQLQTDYLDLLQLHQPDNDVAIEESLSALSALVKRGMVRHVGVCNYSVPQLQEAVCVSQSFDDLSIASNQIQYNLLEQTPGSQMRPVAKGEGMGMLVWGPLCSGILSDWYTRNTGLKPKSRIALGREHDAKSRLLQSPAARHVLRTVGVVAQRRSLSVQRVALSWLLAKNEISSVILGPSTSAQLLELVTVSGNELSEEDLLTLDGAAP